MILDILSFQWARTENVPLLPWNMTSQVTHIAEHFIWTAQLCYIKKGRKVQVYLGIWHLMPRASPQKWKKEQERSSGFIHAAWGSFPPSLPSGRALPISSVTLVFHTAASSWPSLDGAGTLSQLDPYCLYTFPNASWNIAGFNSLGFCCIFCNSNTVWDQVYCPQELAPARGQQHFPPWCRPLA